MPGLFTPVVSCAAAAAACLPVLPTPLIMQVLEALAEIAFSPQFLPMRIEKERKAVLAEAQMMNTIEYRIDCQLLTHLHAENNLGCRCAGCGSCLFSPALTVASSSSCVSLCCDFIRHLSDTIEALHFHQLPRHMHGFLRHSKLFLAALVLNALHASRQQLSLSSDWVT
jgi:hypothetical protein